MLIAAVTILALVSSAEGVKNCSEPCLIYSATSQINGIELTTSRTVQLVSNLSQAYALDVHVSEKMVYWSDNFRRVIQRMNLTSGQIEDIIKDDLGSVLGLAVDWESNLIYWTDNVNRRIEVASLDGKNRKLLLGADREEVKRPRGIALYPKKGLMFWTDLVSTPKIERATMAGLNQTLLVDLTSSGQLWPTAVYVDYKQDRIFWMDAWLDAIDSTDLNGNKRRLIKNRIHPFRSIHPIDFTVYGDILYWGDYDTRSIERLNWTTAAYLGNFGSFSSKRVSGVALLHQSLQPNSAGQCSDNNGGCSHLCFHTPFGRLCACPNELILSDDGKTCQATQQFLLFADASQRKIMKVSSHDSRSLRSLPLPDVMRYPAAIGYDTVEDRVYWTDTIRKTISRAFLNGSSFEDIFNTSLLYPYGLAVDIIGRNLYWTDYGTDKLEVSKLDGSHRTALITREIYTPREIVLDVNKGIMYWVELNFGRIEKAEMTGKRRDVLVSGNLSSISGLTLDQEKNRLYWVDSYYDKLEYLNLINNKRVTLIQSSSVLPYPFGLTLLGDYLYWTDWIRDSVYRAHKEDGGNVTAFLTGMYGTYFNIHGYNLSEQMFHGNSSCQYANGGCSHICLLASTGSECACPDVLFLQPDRKTCHPATEEFLLFADSYKRKIMKVSPHDSRSLRSLPLPDVMRYPAAIGYDAVEDRVYWTDIIRRTISRAFLNGSSFEDILNTSLISPYGLAVDFIGRNLYWTDLGTDKLEVSKLDGSNRTALITRDINSPRDIILDVNKGIMYWTDWASSRRIEKAEMTGKGRVVLVSSSLRQPDGLTLDQEKNRLYWVDSYYDKLEYLNLINNERVTLIQSSSVIPFPFGMTLFGDYLYLTDWYQDTVYRVHKDGGDVTAFITGIETPMRIHGYNLTDLVSHGNSSCESNNGGCSHTCLSSYTESGCICPAPLFLQKDGKTCHTDLPEKFLLFAELNRGELVIQSLVDPSEERFVPIMPNFNVRGPMALDIDFKEDRIYWTDVYLGTISRVFINGSSPEILVTENVSSSEGLAVDPLGGNIYWTDAGVPKIEVSRLDGTMRKTLIDQNLDHAVDIILDLYNGLMYWSDRGARHTIEVANMDGTSRRLLVRRGLRNPHGLTLDHINNRLYWVDAWDILEFYDLESHKITTLLESSAIFWYPYGLTLLGDYLYWTDWSKSAIYRADKTTPSTNFTVFARGLSTPADIHAYDRNRQTLPDHPCSSSYGGCSHLCLLRPDGYRCSCPDHLAPGEVCNTSLVTSTVTPSTQTYTTSYSRYGTPSTSDMATSISYTASVSSVPAISLQTLSSSVSSTRPLIASSSYEPTVTPFPTECRPGTCMNGGTCIVPGFYCRCKTYYVWHLCSVYVGGSAVEMDLSMASEKHWSENTLKVSLADACTKFFCGSGECVSQSNSVRKKRSVGKPAYFRPSDIYILGTLLEAGNSLKVEFAVLLPSAEGQTPQVAEPEEVVRMVQETKDDIGEAVGGTIHGATAKPEGQVTQKPTQEPITAKKGQSTSEKETPIAPIAVGVCVSLVVLAILAAFVIYRCRRRRGSNNVTTGGVIQMEQKGMNRSGYSDVAFDNPGYQAKQTNAPSGGGNAMYESISEAREYEVSYEALRPSAMAAKSSGASNPPYPISDPRDTFDEGTETIRI